MNRTLYVTAALLLLPGVDLTAGQPLPDEAPLSGPRVGDGSLTPSIVERSFDGSLKRLDVRPEEAAVRKLVLSPEEQSASDAVLKERAAMMDRIVRENIDLLVRQQSAKTAGDTKALNEINNEFREAMKPLAVGGRLTEKLSATLTPDNAAKFNSMVRDYYRALIVEGTKTRPAGDPMDDPETGRRGLMAKQFQEVFGQEVRRSYDRIAAEGEGRLEHLIGRLELTPEQETKVRQLAAEFAQSAKLNPTPGQRAELFRKVLAELTPAQRARAIELVTRGW